MHETSKDFFAYEIYPRREMELTTAGMTREWMEATPGHYAYHCLPLVMANQAGWVIGSPATFVASWDGEEPAASLKLEFEGPEHNWVHTHFGSGILTFSIPFLFRTPPGVNLWVRGPANSPKDGIHALEGIVETDWSPATFTMNWKMTRAHHVVYFQVGEPICMVVPVSRGLAEELIPQRLPLSANPVLGEQYAAWDKARLQHLEGLRRWQPGDSRLGLQKDYHKGEMPLGARASQHQTRLHLREFTDGPADVTVQPAPAVPVSKPTRTPTLAPRKVDPTLTTVFTARFTVSDTGEIAPKGGNLPFPIATVISTALPDALPY
jgi:hypothetical protein